MNLIQQSFLRLFPNQEFVYQSELEYNRRLADFNANIRLVQNKIKVNLNLQWKDIDDEIKIGLIQHLLLKVFKTKLRQITAPIKSTSNIELYLNFVKNIPLFAAKTESDPALESSFNRVNLPYLNNSLEKPNLKWGQQSFRKLAHYNFHDDSITVSTIFQNAPTYVLDYIMYHEMLHKYHQFQHRNGRSSYHSKQFKEDEAKYPQQQMVESKIKELIKNKIKQQRKGLWRFF